MKKVIIIVLIIVIAGLVLALLNQLPFVPKMLLSLVWGFLVGFSAIKFIRKHP